MAILGFLLRDDGVQLLYGLVLAIDLALELVHEFWLVSHVRQLLL